MEHAHLTIYSVNALAGAGKTYALIRQAHRWAKRGNKVLFVQPTRHLIDKTVADELGALDPIRHFVIHGDTEPSVTSAIVRHFKDADDGGEILFITHAAFLRTPYFERSDRWIVIVDEVPQVDLFAEFNIPDTQDLLVPYLDVEPFDARYGLAKPADDGGRGALTRIARNKDQDDVWGLFEGFASRVLSEHWSVFVLQNQFENLRSGAAEQRRLVSYSMLEPSIFAGFGQVVIASACFEDTMLYRLWVGQGVKFKPLNLPLRYERHGNGALIRILYATEEAWSKALRNRRAEADCDDERTILDRIVESVRAEVGSQPFNWMGNKDVSDDIFGVPTAVRLPNAPHGLNEFQGVHNTVVLSALNPPPSHFNFLAARGVDGEEVKTALYRAAVYQATMRSSIRNPKDQNPKTAIVMDEATAHWLADLFPAAVVAPLGGRALAPVKGKAGRPLVHKTPADRKATYRRRIELELLIEQDIITGGDLTSGDYPDLAAEVRSAMREVSGSRDEMSLREGDYVSSAGTLFGSIYDTEPLDHINYGDDESFIAGLRDLHRRVIAGKEHAGLISPAHFDPDMDAETSRGLANVRQLRGVWLDNDGGDLAPDVFAGLLPRQRIVVWNTYSSTPEKRRWRVFIPTTQAMSMKVYRLILDQFIKVLNAEGYWSAKQLAENPRIKTRRTHGFDLGKLNPASLFYLPAQARHPEGSFFTDYGQDDPKRRPIEPWVWIKHSILHPNPEPERPAPVIIPSAPCGGGSAKLEAIRAALRAESSARKGRIIRAEAVQIWREIARQPETGHHAFFCLGAALKRSGLDEFDVRLALTEEAAFGRHPTERRREIAEIMRSLRR